MRARLGEGTGDAEDLIEYSPMALECATATKSPGGHEGLEEHQPSIAHQSVDQGVPRVACRFFLPKKLK